MAKYNEEFKLKIVEEYLKVPLSFGAMAKKYRIPNKGPIQNWVHSYQEFGVDSLRRKILRRFILFDLCWMY